MTKQKWTDLLENDVKMRLDNCRSLKSDVLPLAQANWAMMKDKEGFTKEDALGEILDLLDWNSISFDLTKDEYNNILYSIL